MSRCQRFDFRKLSLSELTGRLQKLADSEKTKIEKTALELIALSSGGSVRDAESLLGQILMIAGQKKTAITAQDIRQFLGMTETKSAADLAGLIAQKKPSEAVAYLNDIVQRGYDIAEYGKNLLSYLRQALILTIAGAKETKNDNFMIVGLTDEEFEILRAQTLAMGEAKIKKTIEALLEAQGRIKYSPIPQLPLEIALVESCSL
jgi:DNA polymerase-3 subunit gamma/tau